MAPDFDLSNLRNEQIEIWICLHVDVIFGEIKAAQTKRLGFPRAQKGRTISVRTGNPQAIFAYGSRGADA